MTPSTHKLQPAPHTFADVREAANALAAYVAQWSGYQQWELIAVFSGGERALAGFNVRAKDLDGFGVGYLAPVELPTVGRVVVKGPFAPVNALLYPNGRKTESHHYAIFNGEGRRIMGGTFGAGTAQAVQYAKGQAAKHGLENPAVEILAPAPGEQ